MDEKKSNSRKEVTPVLPETAHQISSGLFFSPFIKMLGLRSLTWYDSWLQIAFVLITGINSAYVLGYSGTIMVSLGWVGGVVGLVLATAISLYANALIAKLHEYGGKRHIRYRDLAGFVYGKKVYGLTWGCQYINLFMINCGYIILAGSALKAVYITFHDDGILKLPYCIAISGFVCTLFAVGIPHLSALGAWLIFSTFLSLIYIVVAIVLSLKDGLEAPPRDYSIPETDKVISVIGASANLVFAFNTGMLPEIQATVKQPVVENMLKALNFQFSVGVIPMYAVTFIGYWAYGSKTSTYLLSSVNGPAWVKTMANIAAFLHSVISLHIFASPTYEFLDTKYKVSGNPFSVTNIMFRLLARGSYLSISTLLSALLPFLGDFMSLTGAFSTFPLTFILANHMYMKAKKDSIGVPQKGWHWLNVLFFSALSVATAVAAITLIAAHSSTYNVFADF